MVHLDIASGDHDAAPGSLDGGAISRRGDRRGLRQDDTVVGTLPLGANCTTG